MTLHLYEALKSFEYTHIHTDTVTLLVMQHCLGISMAFSLSLSAILLLVLLSVSVSGQQRSRRGPVIFNFGDSNSDTGGLVAGLGYSINPPYGRTYFRRSTGRMSDGRLMIDFLCKWSPS